MGMAMKMDVAGMLALPLPQRVVAQDDLAAVAAGQGAHHVDTMPATEVYT